jgi:hypothetical protein
MLSSCNWAYLESCPYVGSRVSFIPLKGDNGAAAEESGGKGAGAKIW